MTAGIILLMVVSGLIRYVHDSRSSHAATALATMVSTTATVRRVGAGERQIPSEELVVGDIVTLSAGDIVPADCKLLESRDLRIAQGALTGESMPVRKDAAALLAAGARDTALTDAACLVFMGTTVISGSALAVVIATGRSALFGGLSRAFQWQRPRTRFERGMNSTSWMLMAFTAVTVPVSMLVTGIASGDWLQALLFGVSVAVGLTPEMLPLIVTVCLSRGADDGLRQGHRQAARRHRDAGRHGRAVRRQDRHTYQRRHQARPGAEHERVELVLRAACGMADHTDSPHDEQSVG